jgi:putative transposase
VADLTYVKSHSGWVYVAFIIDVFSRAIVGWQISTSLRSDLAIDALEMAIYSRSAHDLSGLIHHSDRGVQYLSIRYSNASARLRSSPRSAPGATATIALAESFNGLYKTELIHRKGPWRNIEHVEWVTLNYISWFNNRRIHESLDYVTPIEFETHYYGSNESERLAV